MVTAIFYSEKNNFLGEFKPRDVSCNQSSASAVSSLQYPAVAEELGSRWLQQALATASTHRRGDGGEEGHWVALDERNLAPSEVLEMLNRLLDDNRELMVPNTQEVIKRHPDFAIFATQNPSGVYVYPCSLCVRASSLHDSAINLMPLLFQVWGPQRTFKGFQKQIYLDARRGSTRL
jgi:hypothetical protein